MSDIYYRKLTGYKYELVDDYEHVLPFAPQSFQARLFDLIPGEKPGTSVLTISAGYAWDGPSGPAIDTRNFMRGSLVHDVLYQAMRGGLMSRYWREATDNELHRVCREDGMSRVRAAWVRWAVRSFAARAARNGREGQDVILTAP